MWPFKPKPKRKTAERGYGGRWHSIGTRQIGCAADLAKGNGNGAEASTRIAQNA